MDPLATLTAAGLDATALQQSSDGALTIGWPAPEAVAADELPRLGDGDAAELLSLGGVLGEGGMGVVYHGFQRGLDRAVAVKALKRRSDDRRLAALVREARVVGAVAHPNVVPVHLLARDADGLPLMVMKRIEGHSWSDLLREEGGLSAAERVDDERLDRHLRVLMQVANALEHAHSTDVIHRDVKPSNVMLGSHGEVYLVDWGLAAAVGGRAPAGLPAATVSLHLVGTPSYLSPEQAACDGESLGPATDVYLMGAVLYRLVAGRPPHLGDTALDRLQSALSTDARDWPPEVPPELAAIGARAMAFEPAQRYASAAGMRDAIDAFLRGRTRRRLLAQADRSRHDLHALLAADAHLSELNEAFGACRFAYRQAAAEGGDAKPIDAALQDVTSAMLKRALDDGRVSAAEALLTELPHADPDLAEACAAARSAIEQRDARLRVLEHEKDETYGDRVRGWLALGPSAVWLAIHIPVGWLHRHEGLDVPVGLYAAFVGAFLAVCLAIVPFFRHTLFGHPVNRRTSTAALTLVGVFLGILVLATALEMPLLHAFVFTSWVATCTWVVGAVSIEPVQAFAAVIHGLCLPLFVLFPEWLYELTGISVFVAHGGLGAIWIRRARRGPVSGDPPTVLP